jgi:hypothetical protein
MIAPHVPVLLAIYTPSMEIIATGCADPSHNQFLVHALWEGDSMTLSNRVSPVDITKV